MPDPTDLPPGIVPVLISADPAAAAALLARDFGFAAESPGVMRLGDQRVALAPGAAAVGARGVIDHLALRTGDLARARAAFEARGARLAPAVTPDGPLYIPEFWQGGVDYVFFDGPGGALVELCAHRGTDWPQGPGQGHVGIACADIAGMARFLAAMGFRPAAEVRLLRPEGVTEVAFLTLGSSTAELFSPPEMRAPGALPRPPGPWAALRIAGLAAPQAGPEGLRVEPLAPG